MGKNKYKMIGITFIIISITFLIYSIFDFKILVLLGSIITGTNGIAILFYKPKDKTSPEEVQE